MENWLKYFLGVAVLFAAPPVLLTAGYACPGSVAESFGNAMVAGFLSFVGPLSSMVPQVEHHAEVLTMHGYPCNIDLVRVVFTYNTLLVLPVFLLSLPRMRWIFDGAEYYAFLRCRTARAKVRVARQILLFTAAILVGGLWITFGASTLKIPPVDVFDSRVHVNKWYVVIESLKVAILTYVMVMFVYVVNFYRQTVHLVKTEGSGKPNATS